LTSSAQEAAGARVRELLERIAQTAGVDASVELHEGPEGLIAEYVGEDLDVLVGQHGETIDAIQHLAYRFAMSGYRERVPVLVDAAGYRERRAEALRATADQAAQAALEGRRAVPLDAMGALERKVIHEHLKGRRDIETYSEGQEPSRHLVVAPLVD
jgi:spoIIIJ-associated protein